MIKIGEDELLDTQEAATRSRMTYDHMSRLARKGSIQAHRMGSFWLISATSLQAYLDTPRHPGRKPAQAL